VAASPAAASTPAAFKAHATAVAVHSPAVEFNSVNKSFIASSPAARHGSIDPGNPLKRDFKASELGSASIRSFPPDSEKRIGQASNADAGARMFGISASPIDRSAFSSRLRSQRYEAFIF
jgi:hypothetical protein